MAAKQEVHSSLKWANIATTENHGKAVHDERLSVVHHVDIRIVSATTSLLPVMPAMSSPLHRTSHGFAAVLKLTFARSHFCTIVCVQRMLCSLLQFQSFRFRFFICISLNAAAVAGSPQACVELLCEVEAYDDAVALALSFDRALAASVARRPDDEGQRRTAWLAIASHLFANRAPDAQAHSSS